MPWPPAVPDARLPRRARAAVPLAALALVGAVPSAWAQDAAVGRATQVGGSLETALVATEGGSQAARGDSRTDLALVLRPGLTVSSRSGRVQGSFSYVADFIQHSRRTEGSELQNSLNASGRAEVIEGSGYIDGTATISKRSLDPFGRQSAQGSYQANDNLAEVGTLTLTPRLTGRLGDVAVADVRLNLSATNARHSYAADSTTTGGSASLNSASSAALLGWGLSGSSQRTDYRIGRTTQTDRVTLSLKINPDPEIRFVLRGGQEQTNVTSLDRQRYDNWGGQVQWTPNERTSLDASTDRRYFGTSHQLRFAHRFPLSSFSIGAMRDATNGTEGTAAGQTTTLYQQLFSLFTSAIPDPVERERFVRELLAAEGLDPNTTVGGGFVNSGVTLQRREDLAWIYNGKRLSLAAQGFRSRVRVIDNPNTTVADPGTQQSGYTGTASWRLTPTGSVSLLGSRTMTKGNDTRAGTDLKSLSLSYTEQLGRYTSAAFSARYSVFNSTTDPYRETAMRASLSMRF